MKAIICTKHGSPDVLQLIEVEKPAPQDDEVLIKIHAAAVTVSDCIVRSGKVNILLWIPMRIFIGFRRPRKPVLGLELAGEIDAIGKDVKRFKIGDQIFALTGKFWCLCRVRLSARRRSMHATRQYYGIKTVQCNL